LYVNARGLTSSLIPFEGRGFEIQYDFVEHVLDVKITDGTGARIALRPQSVAEFHDRVMAALGKLDCRCDQRPAMRNRRCHSLRR
jgi:hypothetical protein